jgi:hypothetical protein
VGQPDDAGRVEDVEEEELVAEVADGQLPEGRDEEVAQRAPDAAARGGETREETLEGGVLGTRLDEELCPFAWVDEAPSSLLAAIHSTSWLMPVMHALL